MVVDNKWTVLNRIVERIFAIIRVKDDKGLNEYHNNEKLYKGKQ